MESIGDFFRNYGTPVATTIAIVNSIITLVTGQFFKDSPRARIILVVTSVALSVLAVGATFYSQYQIVASAQTQIQKRLAMKNLLGVAISECKLLIVKPRTESQDDSNAYINEGNAWIIKTVDLIEQAYGKGEAELFTSSAGIEIFNSRGHPNVLTRSEMVARSQRLGELIQRVDTISMLPGFDPRNYQPPK